VSTNDDSAHAAGDAVVQQASHRLSASICSYDHVGRFGGDEFLVVLYNCDQGQAGILSERLRQSVVSPSMKSLSQYWCSLLMSCSTFAKQTGRNRVQGAPVPAA